MKERNGILMIFIVNLIIVGANLRVCPEREEKKGEH
jgi:hypothetical protein